MMPADTPEYMAPAWLGCLSFASRQPEILAWFHDATGMPTTLGGSPIEQMIDEATGYDKKVITAFVQFVNANIWGPIDGKGDEE